MRTLSLVAAFISCSSPLAASEPEATVAVTPSAPVYGQTLANGKADIVLQNVRITNSSDNDVTLEKVQIDFLHGDRLTARHFIPAEEFIADTRQLAQMASGPAVFFVRSQLLSASEAVELGDPSAVDAVLVAGEFLLSTSDYFTIDAATTRLKVSAHVRTADGQQVSSIFESPVVIANTAQRYSLPLVGVWNMRGLPGVRSHHRRIPSNEFAIDFFKLGADGMLANGDGLVAQNNFGYGLPVLAAADGVVESVISDATQDRTVFRVREGESRQEARRRAGEYQMRRMRANIRSALAGNLITIRHDFEDGSVEYSSYGHLAADSVLVAPGDRVVRGQPIAAVGDTGDSSAVHLHFQINDGPDPFMSRSLPIAFDNLAETFSGQDAGIFVRSQ